MSVFHKGERYVQERLGVEEKVAPFGARSIRSYMPDQHRAFFAAQRMIMLSVLDPNGHPWALPVYGKVGFVSSPDEETLTISVIKSAFSAFNVTLTDGQKIGLLGLDFATRSRNRLNGRIAVVDDNSITISVDQSFGNCPQYIQKRDLAFDGARSKIPTHDVSETPVMDDLAGVMLTSDTLFIASRSGETEGGSRYGADVSHRGGKPGFAKVTPSGSLIWPDFSGNRFYNTLGNIQTDPRVGVFVLNFQSGAGLYILGRARVLWDPVTVADFTGAERFIEVAIERATRVTTGGPLSSGHAEPSPMNEKIGDWPTIPATL